MIIEELGNDRVKLTAEEGYILYDKRNSQEYSEVIIKKEKIKYFGVKAI